MRVNSDNQYEEIETDFRLSDQNHFCIYTDDKGFNERPSYIENHWHEWLEVTEVLEGEMEVDCEGKHWLSKQARWWSLVCRHCIRLLENQESMHSAACISMLAL